MLLLMPCDVLVSTQKAEQVFTFLQPGVSDRDILSLSASTAHRREEVSAAGQRFFRPCCRQHTPFFIAQRKKKKKTPQTN